MIKYKFINQYYRTKALEYGIRHERLTRMLELINKFENQRILDVGCATGDFGQLLRRRGHYVIGIDISQLAINRAKKVLHAAYVVDIERQQLPKLKKFDLIILGDIIEHLFQPELTLKKVIKLLNPKGFILITTPNFLYWGNRISIFLGRFKYSQKGMFDESHIRFYSYQSLLELINNSGLNVTNQNHLSAGLYSQCLVKLFPSMFAYHFIVLAQKNKQ